jgi:hypothetical protein
MLMSVAGPARFLSYTGQRLSIMAQNLLMGFSTIMLPIQYHYRYLILKKYELI